MKIVTELNYPAISWRAFDWAAYFEGQEEDGPRGFGPTEKAAILDLHANTDLQHVEAVREALAAREAAIDAECADSIADVLARNEARNANRCLSERASDLAQD